MYVWEQAWAYHVGLLAEILPAIIGQYVHTFNNLAGEQKIATGERDCWLADRLRLCGRDLGRGTLIVAPCMHAQNEWTGGVYHTRMQVDYTKSTL